MILTNSTLSSIPTYTMGVYKLGEEVHQKMDSIRSQFFWSGTGDKFRYHMVKWEQMCLPKDFGGLGIINTRIFNDTLLLKWVWGLLRDKEGDLCCQLLKAKYYKNKPFTKSKVGIGSKFWKGIQKIRHKINFGLKKVVLNGESTLF